MFFANVCVSANTCKLSVPKDAQVDVSITDMSGNALNSEIVVFKSAANGTEFQGLSDSTGRFSLRLPTGSKYEIFILGFHDSTSQGMLDILALTGTQILYECL